MRPTDEQYEAIRLFRTGDSLAIEAGAGTGKTSTLVMLSEEGTGNRRGQYVAFNKALVTDSDGKFPAWVSCNTAHSLAFRAYGKEFGHRLRGEKMRGREMAQALGLMNIQTTDFKDQPKTLYAGFLGGIVKQAVRRFCQSADPDITERHFPFIEGLDEPGTWNTQNEIRRQLLPAAWRLWDDLQQPYGWAPYEHDHYLKAWQLNEPFIPADYILFDEAQDANPVIADIVAQQADHAQLVYVGDSQQEIYGWTGAVNALARVDVANRTFLTQSFRFGDAIAEVANDVLEKLHAQLRLTGNPDMNSEVGQLPLPKAILTRTNATGISRLLALQANNRSAHLIGGSSDVLGFARAVDELQASGHTSHPELAMFTDWQSVHEYVEQDEDGKDLALMVRIVDLFGTGTIIEALTNMVPLDRAEVVISTAHKAKGRQWPTVQLTDDFNGKESAESQRLLYVAVTRAQDILDISQLAEGLFENVLTTGAVE